jgi:hypothetical protein
LLLPPQQPTIDAAKELCDQSAIVKLLFRGLLNNKINDWVSPMIEASTVERLAICSRRQAIDALQAMERAGLGKVTMGRRGWETRLKSQWILRELFPLALGEPDNRIEQKAARDREISLRMARESVARSHGVEPDRVEISIRLT